MRLETVLYGHHGVHIEPPSRPGQPETLTIWYALFQTTGKHLLTIVRAIIGTAAVCASPPFDTVSARPSYPAPPTIPPPDPQFLR